MRLPSGAAALLVALPVLAAPTAPPPPTVSGPAARLVGAALVGGQAFATARSLTDHVGHRLAGTPQAEQAVAWGIEELRRAGLQKVHREPVRLRRWERGEARLAVVGSPPRPLHALALGNSVGTPGEGITAEVVEAATFEQVAALGERARGKIVFINGVMQRSARSFEAYGKVVIQRSQGSVAAAKLGAVATVIRSVGTGSHHLPHTGATRYDEAGGNVPIAALAAEDADLLHRLLEEGGPVKLQLFLGCGHGDEVESANVVGDLLGRERPEEVVLLGCHLDSWDVGQGALDDAAGCAMVIEAARLLGQLGLRPRRTVRVVLFMNEERGLDGARAYAAQHAGEVAKHVAVFEADSGAGRPYGVTIAGNGEAVAMVQRIVAPLAPLGAHEVNVSTEAGADLLPLQRAGVPVLGLFQNLSDYFDWHHTAGDTLDKIDPIDLALGAAVTATLAHGLAEMKERLPPSPPPRH